jgi:hypothetical protein
MSLVVLATLAVCFTLWAAQEIILPVLLAMFFALVGNPILRLLGKLWIPRFLAAVLVIGVGLEWRGRAGRAAGGPGDGMGTGSAAAAAQGGLGRCRT